MTVISGQSPRAGATETTSSADSNTPDNSHGRGDDDAYHLVSNYGLE
ncbi:hypothetical protein T261_6996 [Streptomyces lydicus]|nr:hypothetical protein T261_6996 [Streptomyces lydicus]